MSTAWQQACKVKKEAQGKLIPAEWRVSVEPTLKNVTQVPRECGILSAREIEITEVDNLDELVNNIATSKWTSYEVTVRGYFFNMQKRL